MERRQNLSTELVDLIVRHVWNGVLEHVKTIEGSQEARIRDFAGYFPLHRACSRMAPENVTKALLDAFPEAVSALDCLGRLPLHHACSRGAPISLIRTLINAHPDGASRADRKGRLPLHYACARINDPRVVELLLEVFPASASSLDKEKRLPLHFCCFCSCYDGEGDSEARSAVTLFILRSYPEGASNVDSRGSLPIHYACSEVRSSTFPPPEVLRALLEAYPEGAVTTDRNGVMPIHLVRDLSEGIIDIPPSSTEEITSCVVDSFHVEQDDSADYDDPETRSLQSNMNRVGEGRENVSPRRVSPTCEDTPSQFAL